MSVIRAKRVEYIEVLFEGSKLYKRDNTGNWFTVQNRKVSKEKDKELEEKYRKYLNEKV